MLNSTQGNHKTPWRDNSHLFVNTIFLDLYTSVRILGW